jgi:hypothetical protein
MDKITIKAAEVGKEYMFELNEVMKIRRSRKKIWKDSYTDESVKDLITMAEGKIRRFKNSSDVNAQIDSLEDSVNYLIFALINFRKKNKK